MSNFWQNEQIRRAGRFLRDRLMPEFSSAFTITCVSLVGVLMFLALANWAATAYLRSNPDVLLSHAERINENTRSVRESMIPYDKIADWYDLESPEELRLMWNENYSSKVQFESYVHYRAGHQIGNYYGVTEAGYRMVKDQGPWPVDRANLNIFFFGGSTSFGVGPYWGTVASYLQEELNQANPFGKPVKVYNFGRSGYHSNQEQILFHRLISDGHIPDAVVFLDGLNDFCFRDGQPSSWQMLARFFDGVNERAREPKHETDWTSLRKFVVDLPITKLIGVILDRADEAPIPTYTGPEGAIDEPSPPMEELEKVFDRYLGNISQVEAVANALGVASYFVWQPIPTYNYDAKNHLFYPDRLNCHTGSKFGYPMVKERLRGGLNIDRFIWAADIQEERNENLYIDAFHYTAPFSRDLAEFIAGQMLEPSTTVEEN